MDLFAPCGRYTPDTELPVEPCCTTCRALDDVWPCPELCRRFQRIAYQEVIPSIPVYSTSAGCCAGKGGNS